MRLVACVLLLAAALGCANRSNPSTARITMPSPDGCFVQVWDAPGYGGRTDYINGPRTYSTLREMPGGTRWDKRISSAHVGPAAVATAYTGEGFQGRSLPLRRGVKYPELPGDVSGRIASLRVDCSPAPAE